MRFRRDASSEMTIARPLKRPRYMTLAVATGTVIASTKSPGRPKPPEIASPGTACGTRRRPMSGREGSRHTERKRSQNGVRHNT